MASVRDRLIGAALLISAAAALVPSTAHGQQVVCSKIAGGLLKCIVVAPTESPNAEQTYGGGNGGGPPLKWTRTRIQDSIGAPPSCERTVASPAGPLQDFGIPWLIVVQNLETGDYTRIRLQCQFSGDNPPPVPPPPPTIVDVITDTDIGSTFALETGISPPVERRGVSQLPTWFWCSNAAPVNVVAEVLPYRASARAVVTGVTWTIIGPDGTITKTAQSCGAEPNIESNGEVAAATWTPNEPGVSTITLTTTWSAQWTYTYVDPVNGPIVLGTFDFGTIPFSSEPFTYDVYEIQTVGVANP